MRQRTRLSGYHRRVVAHAQSHTGPHNTIRAGWRSGEDGRDYAASCGEVMPARTAAMRTQQGPGSGRGERRADRPDRALRGGRRGSRGSCRTRGCGARSARRWNGQLTSAISPSRRVGSYPYRARASSTGSGASSSARRAGHVTRLLADRRGRRPGQSREAFRDRVPRSAPPRRWQPPAATRPGRSGVRGPMPTPRRRGGR